MIIGLILNVFIATLAIVFNVVGLPTITTLPTINGYDIDAALVGGMSAFWTYANAVWPVRDMFLGFMALAFYFAVKMLLQFFLGHRAPGQK